MRIVSHRRVTSSDLKFLKSSQLGHVDVGNLENVSFTLIHENTFSLGALLKATYAYETKFCVLINLRLAQAKCI